MKTLEEVVIEAKRDIIWRLKEKEMERNEFFSTLKDYFKKERFNEEYGVRLGASLVSRKLKIYTGLRKTYYSLPHTKISYEAKEDIAKLNNIKKSAIKYIRKKYIKRLRESDINNVIDEYLESKKVPYDLTQTEKERVKKFLPYVIRVHIRLIKYEEDPFDKLIDKII